MPCLGYSLNTKSLLQHFRIKLRKWRSPFNPSITQPLLTQLSQLRQKPLQSLFVRFEDQPCREGYERLRPISEIELLGCFSNNIGQGHHG